MNTMSADEDTEETPLRRRTALVLLFGGAVGLGTLASTDDENSPDLSSEESALRELADIIDSTDLRNPEKNSVIRLSITETLESVNTSLSEKGIDPSGKTPSSTPSIGTGNINQALQYYQDLQQTLVEGESLSEKVETRESASLNTKYLESGSDQTKRLPDVGSVFSKFSSTVDARTATDVPPTTQRLLPNRDAVNSELRQQRTVYEAHIDMQELFLKVISSIHSGVNAFEHSSFESAGHTFEKAKKEASVQISGDLKEYKLTAHSMSLGEYSKIFGLYQRAAGNMTAACAEGLSREARNQKIDRGISKQFKARSVFADQG